MNMPQGLMRFRRWPLAMCCLLPLLLGHSRPAAACGPGVHVREALRFLELLAQVDPSWADWDADPLAPSYLALGSIAPDFQWAVPALPFGHDLGLSYRLLEAAEDQPLRFRLFALGHLSHLTSDPACEMFIGPTLFSAAPVGVFDLFEDDRGARAEQEGLLEAFGDLILGDWSGVVDLLYDCWFESPEAQARGDELLRWYCETGSAGSLDCERVLTQFHALLDRGAPLLGQLDRAAAQELVANLLAQPPLALLDLFTSGLLDSFIGGEFTRTPWFERELERLQQSPLVDPEFWALYDRSLSELGPAWTLERFLEHPRPAWPSWEPNAQISGNLASILRFLPDEYQVATGLVVDGLWYVDEAGQEVRSVTPERIGQPLTAVVRCYSALPWTGTIQGRVRQDQPGSAGAGDEIVGQSEISLQIDPLRYVSVPRAELRIPFVAEPGGGLGFYLELTAEGEPRPWYTTSWDRLWQIGALPVELPFLRASFGTYGHWPPSLPVAERGDQPAMLLVVARLAPAGRGLGLVEVTANPSEEAEAAAVRTNSGSNGLALFDRLPPGSWLLQAHSPGYLAEEAPPLLLEPGREHWTEIRLHPLPVLHLDGPYVAAQPCLRVTWDPTPFEDQLLAFRAAAGAVEAEAEEPAWTMAEAELAPAGRGQLCPPAWPPDGTRLQVTGRARYRDGSEGPTGESAPAILDCSPPMVELEVLEELDPPACAPSLPFWPGHRVRWLIREAHSPITELAWRSGEEEWQPIELTEPEPQPAPRAVELSLPSSDVASPIQLRVRNAAGLETRSAPVIRPGWGQDQLCPTADGGGGGDAETSDGGAPDSGPPETDTGPTDLAPIPEVSQSTEVGLPDQGPARADLAGPAAGSSQESGCRCGQAGSTRSGPQGWPWLILMAAWLIGRCRFASREG